MRPLLQPELYLNAAWRPALLRLSHHPGAPVLAHLTRTVFPPPGINAFGISAKSASFFLVH